MTLKEFKNFKLTGGEAELRQFANAATARVSGGWQRCEELEQRLPEPGKMTCFTCEEAPGRPAAALWVSAHEAGNLRVTNIVPRTKSRLSYDEYNAILDEFATRIAKPVAQVLGLSVETTEGVFRMEDYVSDATLRALRGFSSGANKESGSAHPMDEQRWFAFVVRAHKEDSQLGASDLQRWLRSDGWDGDQASKLMEEYEQYRALLSFYDQFHAS